MPIADPVKIWPELEREGVDEVRKKLAMGAYARYKIPVIEEWLRRNEAKASGHKMTDEQPATVHPGQPKSANGVPARMWQMTKLFLLRIWHDPVWSKVIAVGIVAVIGVSWAWLKNVDNRSGDIIGKNTPKEGQSSEKSTSLLPEVEPPFPKPPKIDENEGEPNEFKLLINRDITIRVGKPNIAIVIESKKTESGFTPENTLYNLLRTEKVNLIINLFKEESFKAKGFFREIYDGNIKLLRQANALSKIDYLILGKLNYSFQKDARIDRDLISCNINFSYKIINKNAEIVRSDSFSVIGPGFSEDAALERGLEILSEKYSNRILKPIF